MEFCQEGKMKKMRIVLYMVFAILFLIASLLSTWYYLADKERNRKYLERKYGVETSIPESVPSGALPLVQWL